MTHKIDIMNDQKVLISYNPHKHTINYCIINERKRPIIMPFPNLTL